MITGIHFILTYMCNLQCDHCFVYSGPSAGGTFTLSQVQKVLDESKRTGIVDWIYFEGGEPFLFYPLLMESVRIARRLGFKVGVVTNAYFATSREDAGLWLDPLHKLGIDDLSISDDAFHSTGEDDSSAKRALATAHQLGLPAGAICIEKPSVDASINSEHAKGKPVIGGGTIFRGRAAEKLVEGLPRRPWAEFTECPYENLANPERVHVDAYGNVHLCQGLSMGNMWEAPLSRMIKNYDVEAHPLGRHLSRGGPALLAKKYSPRHAGEYVDACHFCYALRLSLIDQFPQYLAPRQVYGLA